MNRIVQIMACGIEHTTAKTMAQMLLESETENSELRKERDDWRDKYESLLAKPEACEKQSVNRVLTLEEVRAMREGDKVWIEDRKHERFDGLYTRTNDRLRLESSPYGWAPFQPDNLYSFDYRAWSNGKPTPAESAAVPWERDPE